MFHKCQSESEVKKLFRRIAMRLHPDHGGEHTLMILLQESYEKALASFKDEDFSHFEESHEDDNKSSQNERKRPTDSSEPFNGVYEKVTEKVCKGDPRLGIIIDIFKYSKKNKDFDVKFVSSVIEFISKTGFATSLQYNALVKIYYAFNMNEEENDDE